MQVRGAVDDYNGYDWKNQILVIMTIKELKQAIADLPDNMDVFVGERLTEFTYGLVNSAQVRSIEFKEDDDPDSPVLANDTVLVLTED